MELGNKIKKLRINKGITQEILAQQFGVTYQAVSRWENNVTMPDISLLPEIAVYFGVTIDELFEMSADKHKERIRNMLEEKEHISEYELKEAENFLLEHVRRNRKDGEAYNLLASTYNLYGWQHLRLAEEYAKLAIDNGCNEKSVHNIINDANRGYQTDWNFNNHHNVISYYMDLLDKNPEDRRMCLYALDYLIADGRIQESYRVLSILRKIDSNAYIVKEYEGLILRAEHKITQAFKVWNQMVEEHKGEWIVWACMGNHYADMCEYEKAIDCHEKAYSLQAKPRYWDSCEVIAHISEIRGQYDKAIMMYEEILHLLADEWNITFGCCVDKFNLKIEELRNTLTRNVNGAAKTANGIKSFA